MSKIPKLTRRDFLKLTGIGAATAAVLTGCGPEVRKALLTPAPSEFVTLSTPFPDNQTYYLDSNFDPEAAFLSLATRYNPNLISYIKDPALRQTLASVLLENQKVANGGFAVRQAEAIASGNAIGISICSDSRVCLGGTFPLLVDADAGRALAIPTGRIGAQPSVFQQGVNNSFFIPHQTAECIGGGCGALGGVEALVNNSDGLQMLRNHGVSELTINDINKLIQYGAGSTPEQAKLIEQAWAQTGAKMQAEMNAYTFGGNHYTAYGVYGHSDDAFQVIGVVDNFGNNYPIEKFPLLNSYAQYLNKPHEIIESLAKGQAPTIITINGSRNFSSKSLLGSLADQPGVVFKSETDKIAGRALSLEEARSIVAGGDYGIGALKNGKFLLLTADTAKDMSTLRTMVLTEGIRDGSIAKFLENGGMIVEMIPDKNGRFTTTANVLTREMIDGDLQRLDLLKNGRIGQRAILAEDAFGKQILTRAARDMEIGIISNERYLKIESFLRAAKPFSQFLKYGFQMLGDYFMIRDFARWIIESPYLLDENLVVKNESRQDTVIWSQDNQIILTQDQNMIRDTHNGAQPYLVEGRLDHINVFQNDLVQSHRGAAAAFLKHGPYGTEGVTEPWSNMESNDVGKILKLEIAPPFGTYDGQTIELTTTLVSKPNDFNFDGINIEYNDANPNQLMMLVDQVTGFPIMGDQPEQITVVPAFDPNNPKIVYLFEVQSIPTERRFQFNFIGTVPVENNLSSLPNDITTTEPKYTSNVAASNSSDYGNGWKTVFKYMDKVLDAVS